MLKSKTNNVFFTRKTIRMFESELSNIKRSGKLKYVSIDQSIKNKFIGDLYGLLEEQGVRKELHYVTMRLNDFSNSQDFDGKLPFLLIPDKEYINGLVQIDNTTINTE